MLNIKKIQILTMLSYLDMDDNSKITDSMFDTSHIKSFEKDNSNSLIFVTFYGINGVIPFRLFDEKAKTKILNFLKSRETMLWKTLNESNC